MKKFFNLKENNTDFKTELIAGITTFMTMSYILFVNSNILGAAGMNKSAVLMATALSAGLTTILMGLWTKLPFALAPGMGLNAYFAYTVCKGLSIPWQIALGAIFIDGIIFLVLSILPIREMIIRQIPLNLKLSVSVGIGLFIAFIGLENGKIIVSHPSTLVTIGKLTSPSALLVIFGLLFTGFLMSKRVKGAILYGIIVTTILAFFVKNPSGESLAKIPTKIVALPSIEIFSKTFMKLNIISALKIGVLTIIFTFTFVDMFDTAGTVIGLSAKLGIIDKKGSFPRANRVLLTDAIGTIMGAVFGTSTVTSYIESAAGIAEGGRTGLTSVVCGILFLLSIFLWPLASIIPPEATAPALIIVGLLMMEPIFKINLSDPTEAIPAFLTIIIMPLSYSIANGLIFGILSWTLLKIFTGKFYQISPLMYVLAGLFVAYIIWGMT